MLAFSIIFWKKKKSRTKQRQERWGRLESKKNLSVNIFTCLKCVSCCVYWTLAMTVFIIRIFITDWVLVYLLPGPRIQSLRGPHYHPQPTLHKGTCFIYCCLIILLPNFKNGTGLLCMEVSRGWWGHPDTVPTAAALEHRQTVSLSCCLNGASAGERLGTRSYPGFLQNLV